MNDISYYKVYVKDYAQDEILLLPDAICEFYDLPNINVERNIIRGYNSVYIAAATPSIYLDHFESKSIAKYWRNQLHVIEQNKEYIIFSNSEYENDRKYDLLNTKQKYNAEAIQLVKMDLPHFGEESKLLKKHLGEPRLIPFDWDAKIAYAKTCSKELQRHITEKRGINLD
jgi:hypothetical protein